MKPNTVHSDTSQSETYQFKEVNKPQEYPEDQAEILIYKIRGLSAFSKHLSFRIIYNLLDADPFLHNKREGEGRIPKFGRPFEELQEEEIFDAIRGLGPDELRLIASMVEAVASEMPLESAKEGLSPADYIVAVRNGPNALAAFAAELAKAYPAGPASSAEPSSPDDLPQEKIEAWREVAASKMRNYRSRMTAEEAAEQRAKNAEQGRSRRAQMTPEEAKQHREKDAARKRLQRQKAQTLGMS